MLLYEKYGHVDNEHCDLVKRDSVPNNAQIVPSVWSLRRKRNLTTNKITKHKARLNLHGGKQVYGMNYYETYVPVGTWFAIRLMIIFGILFQWSLRQVDFIMAYPQAPIEMDIYRNSHKALRLQKGTPRTTCSSCSRTCMGRNKQVVNGTSTLLTR
jgi:hypothetical protein